jgi:hypothetical protein
MAQNNKRRHGRVNCQEVTSSMGAVLDLSASGMRIQTRRKPPDQGEILDLTVTGTEGPCLFRVKVMWAKKLGFMKHEIGFTFVDVTPENRQMLASLARQVAHNETFRPWLEGARRAG